jgi:putative ABC transport system ATP-binding protein
MMLRLDRVSKRYDRPNGTRVALDEVSLKIDRGQMVGVFGPSGSGKTTLLRIAAGLRRPDSGTVTYGGERLDRMSSSERARFRRREIACIWAARSWQERLSVLDHVTMPLLVDHCSPRVAERRAREALLACNAEQCLGMELQQLSDGERQRVEIARALITEPRLLLADGPASNLSLVEQEGIMVLLRTLALQARVAILVTDRDAEALLRSDPVLYLRDGKLVNPEPIGEPGGRVYRFPDAASHRAAASDA